MARFGASLPHARPHDHFEVAQLRTRARRCGVQVGTTGAILAQLCIRNGLRLLSTEANFVRIAEHEPPECWTT